jgi:hypothetical protein
MAGASLEPQRLRRAKRNVWLGVGCVVALAIVALVVSVLLLWPFDPMTINSYTPSKKEVCPEELVGMYIDYELTEEAEVREVEVTSNWEVVDVPGLTPGQRVQEVEDKLPGDRMRPGRTVIESSILRSAPPPPGEWRVVSEMLVRGTIHGIPNVQELQVRADDTTTVLDASDKACSS